MGEKDINRQILPFKHAKQMVAFRGAVVAQWIRPRILNCDL